MSKEQDGNEQLKVLSPVRILLADQRRQHWAVDVPLGTKLADVMRPGFWQHHSTRLAPWDVVEVRAEDGSWYGQFLVLATDRSWTRMHKLAYHPLTSQDVAQTQASEEQVEAILATMEVMHRGPRKWSVVRKDSREVLKEDIARKDEALEKMVDLAKAEAAHVALEAESE